MGSHRTTGGWSLDASGLDMGANSNPEHTMSNHLAASFANGGTPAPRLIGVKRLGFLKIPKMVTDRAIKKRSVTYVCKIGTQGGYVR
ncbi:hypothetical protein ACFQX6_51540 [Streptosporangium lutulentum]